MGFVKQVKDVPLVKSSEPKLTQHTNPDPRSRFVKFGKAEDIFTKAELAGETEPNKTFHVPSARGYILERLIDIEKTYLGYPISIGQAKVLRLCGHVRYLRHLLEANNIKYIPNGATLSEQAREWNSNVDDSLWEEERKIYDLLINQKSKPLRFYDGNYVAENEPVYEDDELLDQVEVYDHTGEIDDDDDAYQESD